MKNLFRILFPIKQTFDDLNGPDELEQIQINNYSLAKEMEKYKDIKTIVVNNKMDSDIIKWNEQQKSNRLKAEEELERDYPMKRFDIEVVSGGVVLPYTIEARGFDYSGSGTYYFYTYKIGSHGYKEREIIAHFPIEKTIIKKIEIIKYANN